MFASNPFAGLIDSFHPVVMQVYLVLMTVAVVVGTWWHVHHEGSARFFARCWRRRSSTMVIIIAQPVAPGTRSINMKAKSKNR